MSTADFTTESDASQRGRQGVPPGSPNPLLHAFPPSRHTAPPLYSTPELLQLSEPDWQVAGTIPQGARVVVYGAPGIGKSFLVQDLAHCIAAGLSWFGHPVRAGECLYIAAEGEGFLRSRTEAWLLEHLDDGIDADHPPVFYWLDSVQLFSGHAAELLSAIQRRGLKPTLIVFDTLALCSAGADENSAQDMGVVINAVMSLQEAIEALTGTKPTICLVHHSGKNSRDERGTTALRGVADVMIRVSASGGGLTIENTKQRHAPPFAPIAAQLKSIEVGTSAEGASRTSCVVVAASVRKTQSTNRRPLKPKHFQLLTILKDRSPDTIRTSEWIAASKLQKKDFHNQCEQLLQNGWIEKTGHGRYKLTEPGTKALKMRKVKVNAK